MSKWDKEIPMGKLPRALRGDFELTTYTMYVIKRQTCHDIRRFSLGFPVKISFVFDLCFGCLIQPQVSLLSNLYFTIFKPQINFKYKFYKI